MNEPGPRATGLGELKGMQQFCAEQKFLDPGTKSGVIRREGLAPWIGKIGQHWPHQP